MSLGYASKWAEDTYNEVFKRLSAEDLMKLQGVQKFLSREFITFSI